MPDPTADPWGRYREQVTSLVGSCRDYLTRIERSLAGEIAPDRRYVQEKADDLHHAVRSFVRHLQDVERWLAECGADVHHPDASVAMCTRPSGHGGVCDDAAAAADDHALSMARCLEDDAGATAHLLGERLCASGPYDDADLVDVGKMAGRVSHEAGQLADHISGLEQTRGTVDRWESGLADSRRQQSLPRDHTDDLGLGL